MRRTFSFYITPRGTIGTLENVVVAPQMKLSGIRQKATWEAKQTNIIFRIFV